MTILPRRQSRAALARVLIAITAVAAIAVSVRMASADTGAACSAAYTIGWQTPSNNPPDFGATVTVTNNAPYPITGWTISWTYPAGQTIIPGSPYSAIVVQSGT